MVSVREGATRLFLMTAYLYVLYKDYTTMYNCPNVSRFYGVNGIGGRFKFLTHITMWVNAVYFSISFLVEVFSTKSLRLYADYVFTTVAWGMSCVSVLFFWGLYALDRKNIYPEYMDEYLPVHGFINHAWHTVPLVSCIIECVTLPHYHPPKSVVVGTLFGISISYVAWMLINYHYSRVWAYPFLEKFTPAMFVVFCIFTIAITGLFYVIGHGIAGSIGQIRRSHPKQKSN